MGLHSQVARENGNTAIAEILLNYGADVNIHGGSYGTALQAACKNGHGMIANMLLAVGADVNAQAGVCGAALQAACNSGDVEIVKTEIMGSVIRIRIGRYRASPICVRGMSASSR